MMSFPGRGERASWALRTSFKTIARERFRVIVATGYPCLRPTRLAEFRLAVTCLLQRQQSPDRLHPVVDHPLANGRPGKLMGQVKGRAVNLTEIVLPADGPARAGPVTT